MKHRGQYCLIQYIPDIGRAEAANVGVLVIDKDNNNFEILMQETNDTPIRRFGIRPDGLVSDVHLTQAKIAFKNNLERHLKDGYDIDNFVCANSIHLTKLSTIGIENDLGIEAAKLMITLVEL